MPYCQNCGAQLNEGASFCNNCGARVGAGPAQPEQPPYQSQYQQQYQQQYYQSQYQQPINRMGGGYRANIRKRDLAMTIILSIVTCGIYSWIWLYKTGDKVDRIRQMNGELPSNSGLIYLLCAIFGLSIVSYALIQTELNKVAMDA